MELEIEDSLHTTSEMKNQSGIPNRKLHKHSFLWDFFKYYDFVWKWEFEIVIFIGSFDGHWSESDAFC